MANGTLKVQNIETSSGSGTITLGQSGETIALGSGATQTLALNTPAFHYKGQGTQALSSNTNTALTFANKNLDTNNTFDTSNNRFTPGIAGNFYLYTHARVNCDNGSGAQEHELKIYKNGSAISPEMFQGLYDVTAQIVTFTVSGIVTSDNSTDYFQVFGRATGTNRSYYDSRIFGGFKIIE